MSENNQIQEISKLIASLFSQGFKPEFKNNNPITYYIVDNFGIRSGQVTSGDLKDIVAYQSSALTTYLYDSTGKEKYLGNYGISNDGFIIFDVGE